MHCPHDELRGFLCVWLPRPPVNASRQQIPVSIETPKYQKKEKVRGQIAFSSFLQSIGMNKGVSLEELIL